MTPWQIDALELVNCNCNYGCPCQFNALPTTGACEAAVGFAISKGHYGQARLDGLNAAAMVKWPGPIHQGSGTIQIIVDERADADQRRGIEAILSGRDTDEMATAFWVFNKMSPNRLETLYCPIDVKIDVGERTGRVHVPGLLEITAEPIRNPVTGAPHRARINLPFGFEYRQAEVASGTTKATGAIDLPSNRGTHSHIARIYMNNHGVIDHAA